MEECSSIVSIVGFLGLSLAFGTLVACGASPPSASAEVANDCQPMSDEERAAIAFAPSPGNTPEVDPAWTHAHRCNVRIVDVREAHERVDGEIEGVTSAPLAELPTAAGSWDPREPVVLVCRSGRRSARAVEVLESMGFTRTASMTGGMLRWRDLGLPIQPLVVRNTPEAPARFSPPDPTERSSLSSLLESSHIPMTRVASLLLQNSEACVDGRETQGIVGTPGGDAGELLLALASIEELASRELTADEVRDVFEAHVANFGRFYLHTDSHAMSALRQELQGIPALTALRSGSSEFEAYLRSPPRGDEEALLEHIAAPSAVGCGHLRLVLQHPVEYGVRPELARSLIRVVFRELWRHPEHVSFVVLQGEHHEEAVLNVRLGHEARASSNVPAVPPQLGGRSFFVNHPEVSQYIRREHVALLRSELPWLAELGPEEVLEEVMSGLAERQLISTLRYLARTLPIYDIYFEPGGVRVIEAGAAAPEE